MNESFYLLASSCILMGLPFAGAVIIFLVVLHRNSRDDK